MAERPWIEHDGSGLPVAIGTPVIIRRANGAEKGPYKAGMSRPYLAGSLPVVTHTNHGSNWVWAGAPHGFKIVAYRLASDPEAEARRERYAAIFDDMIKTAPLDIPERQRAPAEQIHNQYEQGDL